MAKCKFPVHMIASHYKTGNRSGCDTKGRLEIVFQGKKMLVCKVHSQFNGRNNPY